MGRPVPGAGRGGLSGTGPARTITVAIMDSSASLKFSMRCECWVPSAASSSLERVGESPCASRAGSGVWGLDMVAPEKKHRSEHARAPLGVSVPLASAVTQAGQGERQRRGAAAATRSASLTTRQSTDGQHPNPVTEGPRQSPDRQNTVRANTKRSVPRASRGAGKTTRGRHQQLGGRVRGTQARRGTRDSHRLQCACPRASPS